MDFCYYLAFAALAVSLTAIALVLRSIPKKDRLTALEQAVDDTRGVVAFILNGTGTKPSDKDPQP